MNDLLKELSLQAGGSHYPTINPELQAKFAELIVRDCCDWIDGSPTTEGGQLILTKSFIIANLKGRFGVK
jgi:hypothetical protein